MTEIFRNWDMWIFLSLWVLTYIQRIFESKEKVLEILDGYNSRMEAQGRDQQVISYTDMVGTLMSSVTDIIDIISYVLIAFVADFAGCIFYYDWGYYLYQCS